MRNSKITGAEVACVQPSRSPLKEFPDFLEGNGTAVPQGGGGGVLEVYMTGGSDGASYCKAKKIHKPEILDPKKYLASKFPNQKNTRLKYLNTDLFT